MNNDMIGKSPERVLSEYCTTKIRFFWFDYTVRNKLPSTNQHCFP